MKPRNVALMLAAIIAMALAIANQVSAADSDSEKAVEALVTAAGDIEEMRLSGFNTTLPNDILTQAKKELYGENYSELKLKAENINETEKREQIQSVIQALQASLQKKQIDYSSIIQDAEQIREIKEKAYEVNDQLVSLRSKIQNIDPHINITAETTMLREAERLFMDELYDDAEQKTRDTFEAVNKKEAEFTELDLIYRIGKENLTNYLKNNWERLTATLIALIIIGYIVTWQATIFITRRKAKLLDLERSVLKKLMMDVQRDRFEKGTITKEDYESLMVAYKERTIDIEKDLPILQQRVEDNTQIIKRIHEKIKARKEALKVLINAALLKTKLLAHKLPRIPLKKKHAIEKLQEQPPKPTEISANRARHLLKKLPSLRPAKVKDLINAAMETAKKIVSSTNAALKKSDRKILLATGSILRPLKRAASYRRKIAQRLKIKRIKLKRKIAHIYGAIWNVKPKRYFKQRKTQIILTTKAKTIISRLSSPFKSALKQISRARQRHLAEMTWIPRKLDLKILRKRKK